ncbi:MAG: hypothetical protein QW153_00495 [Candidatus Bilamarchaeaceae archaeon]
MGRRIAAVIIAAAIILNPHTPLIFKKERPLVEHIKNGERIIKKIDKKNGVYTITDKGIIFEEKNPKVVSVEEVGTINNNGKSIKITKQQIEKGRELIWEDSGCTDFICMKESEDDRVQVLLKNNKGDICVVDIKLEDDIDKVRARVRKMKNSQIPDCR